MAEIAIAEIPFVNIRRTANQGEGFSARSGCVADICNQNPKPMSPDRVQSCVQVIQVPPNKLANLNQVLPSPGPGFMLKEAILIYERRPVMKIVSGREPIKKAGQLGRLRYDAGFKKVRLDGEVFDLSQRPKARACLEYLVSRMAVNGTSACHLKTEIDPEVRRRCRLDPLPANSNLRIHHYFNDCKSNLNQLASKLIRPAGRNGYFFLAVGKKTESDR